MILVFDSMGVSGRSLLDNSRVATALPISNHHIQIAPDGEILLSRPCDLCRNPAGNLKRTPKVRRRDAHHAAEDLREMARAGVAHFESNLDETARSFADQLLGAGDSLAGHDDEKNSSRWHGLLCRT